MKKDKYWTEFWNSNNIINKPTAHEKVGRTINGVPIEESRWQEVLDDMEKRLGISAADSILDIGAGSGVISIPFSKKAAQVVALDVSQKLLSEMASVPNIKTIVADAREADFENNSFDKIIIYFAIQHFSEEETTRLIKKTHDWLKPDGTLFIGDIPDVDQKFSFFNTPERQTAYFNSLINDTPIIGTWFHRDFFSGLSRYAGFRSCEIITQNKNFINAHYRYDALFIK
jgi:cyclopropane fatty-acyl-phospholipid synthase-like methyltransferase